MTTDSDDKKIEEEIEIPMGKLSSDALDNLIEEFILREGTDYGLKEVSFEKKREQVKTQILNQKVKIVYSSLTQDCTLLRVQ